MIEAKYIVHSGDDLLVVNAARVSFDKSSEWDWVDDGKVVWSEPDEDNCVHVVSWPRAAGEVRSGGGRLRTLSARDAKLIGYLAHNGHWTPFAHPQITLHIKAPVFVRTQCFKHKVGFVENEISRRYVDDEPDFYLPLAWRGRADDKKQGSDGIVDDDGLCYYAKIVYDRALESYRHMLGRGVAPEQARMVLPQAMMTEWFWTGSLAAWARFCGQRTGKDAQAETGDVARAAAAIIAPLFPVSWKALTE